MGIQHKFFDFFKSCPLMKALLICHLTLQMSYDLFWIFTSRIYDSVVHIHMVGIEKKQNLLHYMIGNSSIGARPTWKWNVNT